MKTIRESIIQNWLRHPDCINRETANIALAARMFNIQNVYNFTSKIFTKENNNGLEIDDHVLKLPYDAVIFEFHSQIEVLSYGVVCAIDHNNTMAVSVVARASNGNLVVVSLFRFMLNEDGTPKNSYMDEAAFNRLVNKLGLDKVKEFGEFKESYGESSFSHLIPNYEKLTKEQYVASLNAGMDAVTPVLYALNLLNCKNVRQVVKTTHDGLTKRERKSFKAPEFQEYRILDVPLINKVSSGEISIEDITGGGKIPLHTVRGHCKTYTAKKPLMGRHVGRWYWGPTLRGKLSNGIVEKEYATSGTLEVHQSERNDDSSQENYARGERA